MVKNVLKIVFWSFVPACITFGPLFMTSIGGTVAGAREGLVGAGALMLGAGLLVMFLVISGQRKAIEALQEKLANKP